MRPRDIIVQATHTHAGADARGHLGPGAAAATSSSCTTRPSRRSPRRRATRAARAPAGRAPTTRRGSTTSTTSRPTATPAGRRTARSRCCARSTPERRQPIASFVSVPAHGDIVAGSGDKQLLSADYFGFVRAALDERLGGVNVVGPATLGREETPVQVGGLGPSSGSAASSTSIVGRALADAHWITERHRLQHETSSACPAHNAALLALERGVEAARRAASSRMADAQRHLPDRPLHGPALPDRQRRSARRPDRAAHRRQRLPVDAGRAVPRDPRGDRRTRPRAPTRSSRCRRARTTGATSIRPGPGASRRSTTSDHNIYNIAPQAGDQVIQDQARQRRQARLRASNRAVGQAAADALGAGAAARACRRWRRRPGATPAPTARCPSPSRAIYGAAYVGRQRPRRPASRGLRRRHDGGERQREALRPRLRARPLPGDGHRARHAGPRGALDAAVRVHRRLQATIERRARAGGRDARRQGPGPGLALDALGRSHALRAADRAPEARRYGDADWSPTRRARRRRRRRLTSVSWVTRGVRRAWVPPPA